MTKSALAVLLAMAITSASPVRAALTMDVEVATHVELPAGSGNAPADTRVPLTVTLMEKSFVVKAGSQSTVYDFAARKRIVIDTDKKARVDYSLYDSVGVRVLELKNRVMLGKALAAAKLDAAAASMGTVHDEHVLAIQDTPSSPLRVQVDGASRMFSAGSTILFRESLNSTPIEAADARMFVQFVRYYAGGHPQILKSLENSSAVPVEFVITTHDAGVRTRSFVVRSVRTADDVSIDASRYSRRPAASDIDPVDRALDRAVALTPDDIDAARKRKQAEFAAALQEGRALDAYLSGIEWTLMTGEPFPSITAEQRALLFSDAVAKRIGAAVGARTKESLGDAAKTFAEIVASNPDKAYVLKIFEANDRLQLGDAVSARRLFVETLAVNPFLAGAYKDLGNLLLASYDTPRAWRSWDIGRRLAPKFANFRAVDEFESSLVTKHPEYF